MISVCFRFDDASAKSDHKLERSVFEIFGRRQIPLCVAAIPFAGPVGGTAPLSLRNAAHLFDAARSDIIEIALHGHSHLQRGSDPRGRRTEFAGLQLEEQARLIREGAEHLAAAFNRRIGGFVPPWNTYDASTTAALTDAGFDYISVGFDVYRYGKLPVVPITCTLSTARKAIHRACRFKSLSPVVVVVFHSDDFVEYRYPPRHDEAHPVMTLPALEALLKWIKSKRGVCVEPLSQVASYSLNGTSLRSVSELALPYRVKLPVSPMLVRGPSWTMLPGILWGMLQSRSASAVEVDDDEDAVAVGANDGERF